MSGDPYCSQCWPYKSAVGDHTQYDEILECPSCGREVGVLYETPVGREEIERTNSDEQSLKIDLLRAQQALNFARRVPISDVPYEINEAKGYVDHALQQLEEGTS